MWWSSRLWWLLQGQRGADCHPQEPREARYRPTQHSGPPLHARLETTTMKMLKTWGSWIILLKKMNLNQPTPSHACPWPEWYSCRSCLSTCILITYHKTLNPPTARGKNKVVKFSWRHDAFQRCSFRWWFSHTKKKQHTGRRLVNDDHREEIRQQQKLSPLVKMPRKNAWQIRQNIIYFFSEHFFASSSEE